MDIENRIAIITGSAGGIGREIALELARHRCVPVLLDVNEDRLAGALEEVRRHSPSSTAEVCDVADQARTKQVVESVRERHGSIDILVNNAAIMITKVFDEMPDEEFRQQMNVNFYGPVSMIRAVLPVMEKQGKGVIMNVASVGGKLVVPGTGAYSASKAALYAFSESLHYELKHKGIHVGVVVPGGIRTGIMDAPGSKLGDYYRSQLKTPPAKISGSIRRAIEKERFETVVPFTAKLLLGAHGAFPGLFRRLLLSRLRPYMR